MKLSIKITLFVVLFIAIAGIWFAIHKFNLQHPDTSKVKPDFIVTATALQKEFDDNEATATSRYVKKIIEVTGNILSVTPADSAHTNISLKTGSDMSSVICTFKSLKDPSRFQTGKEITLRGECSGFLMDVLLNNCSVVQKRK